MLAHGRCLNGANAEDALETQALDAQHRMKKAALSKAHSAFADDAEDKKVDLPEKMKKSKKTLKEKSSPVTKASAEELPDKPSVEKTKIKVGLNVVCNKSSSIGAHKSVEKTSLLAQMMKNRHENVKTVPHNVSEPAYDRVPVEDFGAQILQSLGWKAGYGVGSNKNHKETVNSAPLNDLKHLKGEKRGLGLNKSPSVDDAMANSSDCTNESSKACKYKDWVHDCMKVLIAKDLDNTGQFIGKVASVIPGSVSIDPEKNSRLCSLFLDSELVIDAVQEAALAPYFLSLIHI